MRILENDQLLMGSSTSVLVGIVVLKLGSEVSGGGIHIRKHINCFLDRDVRVITFLSFFLSLIRTCFFICTRIRNVRLNLLINGIEMLMDVES